MTAISILEKYENSGLICYYKIRDSSGTTYIVSKEYLLENTDRYYINSKMSIDGKILSSSHIPTVKLNYKTVYHGSSNVVSKPVYGYGKRENDYGIGFYCTENLNLAREWSCSSGVSGVVNRYTLILNGLNILILKKNSQRDILTWLSILLENRTFNIEGKLAQNAKEYILKNYRVNYKDYDVIVGYRADDSYFRYARDFISGVISYEKFSNAIFLGKLGMQVVLKSRKAFSQIVFTGSRSVSGEYISRYLKRDENARLDYRRMKDNSNTTIFDIMEANK